MPTSFKNQVEIVACPQESIRAFLSRKSYSRVFVLVDANTRAYCYPLVQDSFGGHTLIEIPPGEEYKTLHTCSHIWETLTRHAADRHALLIVLGGGVAGDMAGFCAATYKRGIDFVLIPTTLLSMVDAAIGGKLGVDFNHLKNHIGVFKEPVLTLTATQFLQTLPPLELRSGYAEVIKHTLLSDASLWEEISTKPLEKQNWDALIRHSIAYKLSVVEEDPTEQGKRKLLNLGHTVGHALESYYLENQQKIMHGESVAMGLIIETKIARERRWIEETATRQIITYLREIFAPFPVLPPWEALTPLIKQDKKNRGQRIKMTLLQGIGKALWDVETSEEEILRQYSLEE